MKVLAFDTKSAARIREHGDDWTPVRMTVGEDRGLVRLSGLKALMQADKDGYMKWWPISHIEGDPGWVHRRIKIC